MNPRISEKVIIVGAGPAGLSIARQLSVRGIGCTVLEKACTGASWKKTPRSLRVLSPWWTNVLSFSELFEHNPFARVCAAEYFSHLSRFAATTGVVVHEGVAVTEIQRFGSGWKLVTGAGDAWHAPIVILATGYLAKPFIPDDISSDGSVPSIHASSIDDYERFSSPLYGGKVLIVGKRVTAGQLMLELYDRGVGVALSVRSKLVFRRAGLVARLRDHMYFFYEQVRVTFQTRLRANSFPEMDGGRSQTLVESGVVTVHAQIKAIRMGKVIFSDGKKCSADIVVFATGYRPALPILPESCTVDSETGKPRMDGFELAGAPGLYAIGLDNTRNFRSRYLRGIRSDARILARQIKASERRAT